MFLFLHACNPEGRSKTESWLESLFFEVNEHILKKRELTLMCASFLSPAHRRLKNGMPRVFNKPITTSPNGWGYAHSCSNVNITVAPPARATAFTQIVLASQGSVWATTAVTDPLLPNVFSKHCSKTASTALSEKVNRHHLVLYTPKNTSTLLSTLSCRCSLAYLVPSHAACGGKGG